MITDFNHHRNYRGLPASHHQQLLHEGSDKSSVPFGWILLAVVTVCAGAYVALSFIIGRLI